MRDQTPLAAAITGRSRRAPVLDRVVRLVAVTGLVAVRELVTQRIAGPVAQLVLIRRLDLVPLPHLVAVARRLLLFLNRRGHLLPLGHRSDRLSTGRSRDPDAASSWA